MPLKGCILPSTKKPTPTGVKLSRSESPSSLGERDHALVGGHDHVVEAIDAMAPEVKRPGKAAGGGGALEQRDARAAFGEAQREHGAEDAGADDADVGLLAGSSPTGDRAQLRGRPCFGPGSASSSLAER